MLTAAWRWQQGEVVSAGRWCAGGGGGGGASSSSELLLWWVELRVVVAIWDDATAIGVKVFLGLFPLGRELTWRTEGNYVQTLPEALIYIDLLQMDNGLLYSSLYSPLAVCCHPPRDSLLPAKPMHHLGLLNDFSLRRQPCRLAPSIHTSPARDPKPGPLHFTPCIMVLNKFQSLAHTLGDGYAPSSVRWAATIRHLVT